MRQIEDETNLSTFPERHGGQLFFRIMIACGLRSKDIRYLPLDCIVRGNAGAPYLAWVNTKVGERIAFFPITEKMTERIRRQQQVVQERFPNGSPWLYQLADLCADLARFTFLLGAGNGEELFSDETA
jgi:hypothetical protein